MKRSARRAIERLHARDMRASAEGDFATLRSLVDDEAVMLPPGGAMRRGATELDAAFARMNNASGSHEVLDYRMDFEEVRIFGNYAVEWGVIRGSTREVKTGRISKSEYHVMRVLRRRKGRWKVYRSIWAPRAE